MEAAVDCLEWDELKNRRGATSATPRWTPAPYAAAASACTTSSAPRTTWQTAVDLVIRQVEPFANEWAPDATV